MRWHSTEYCTRTRRGIFARAMIFLALFAGAFPVMAQLAAGDIVTVSMDPTGVNNLIQIDPMTGAETVLSSAGFLSGSGTIDIDANGQIIVADATHFLSPNRIIRIDPVTGLQTLVVSFSDITNFISAAVTPSGALAVAGNDFVLFPPDLTAQILQVDPVTGVSTIVSINGNLTAPTDIAIDQLGDYVVVDVTTLSVVRIDAVTGVQTVIWQSPAIPLETPRSIAIAANGDLWVGSTTGLASNTTGILSRIDPITGQKTVVSSGFNLEIPDAIEIDELGQLLVVSRSAAFNGTSNRILSIDPVTGAQTVVAATGSSRQYDGIVVVPGLPGECVLDMDASYAADQTLTLNFQIATDASVQWSTWLIAQSSMFPLWSTPIGVIDPAITLPVPIPSFPALGNIAFVTAFTGPDGITCFDFALVNTGGP